MMPERRAVIHGHLVEEFCWHDCPICYVDAIRVTASFDHTVADLQTAGRPFGDDLRSGPLRA